MVLARWSLFVLISVRCCLGALHGQCTSTMSTPIPDNGIIHVGFAVSGLTDANLSSPTQGICGVGLNFNHEYLGDLTITLIAPNGTSVVLVGPPTTTTMNTNLTTWNIQFLPCGSAVTPDPGFTDMWSNDQPWLSIASYSGTYHPQSGCLEDFNTGPANGLWQLVLQDHDVFQLGNLVSFTLIFCNPAGLSCDECSPNAGTLSPTSVFRCEGESIQTSQFALDFGAIGPSGANYNYTYLLIAGSTILQYGASWSSVPPAGSYTICGLSYNESDSIFVNAILESGDYDALMQTVTDGTICGQLTSTCVSVQVEVPPDTIHIQTDLCQGEIFSIGGQDYTTTGNFIQVHDGPGMCDTVYAIRIVPRDLIVAIPLPDTITCGGTQVILTATVSGAQGPFNFLWTTTFGSIISSPSLPGITVDQAGPYTVEVTDGICSGSASTNVHADQGYPQVFIEGGTLTCNEPNLDLTPIFIPSSGTVQWTGPGGFMSNQKDIQVSTAGTYFLTITNENGCSTTRPVDVLIDTSTIDIFIRVIFKFCDFGIATIGVNDYTGASTFVWTGPNGFFSDSWTPNAAAPGIYSVTETFANGCQRSASFFFDGDFSAPDLSLPATDTLHCGSTITLTATSLTPGVTYSWTGPQAFTSAQSSIQVQQAGAYHVLLVAPNGCKTEGMVEVVNGSDIFNFQIFSDTLTCIQDTVSVGVIAPSADVFDWLNYTGPDDTLSSIQVTTEGVYTVMMTDTNSGCTMMTSILVADDYSVPPYTFTGDTITCLDPVANLSFVPSPGVTYAGVYWELPDFTIVSGPVLNSNQLGTHILHAVGTNGCVGNLSIQIPVDTLSPFLLVEGDTLLCMDTAIILSQSFDSIVQYQWVGPGILQNQNSFIEVNEPGLYTLLATGINQCVAEYDIFVDSNFTQPVFQLMYDSIRCDLPATLIATSEDTAATYNWFSLTGTLLSPDSILMTSTPGVYEIAVEGYNRCIARDTVILMPPEFPIIQLEADTITCADTMVAITSTIDIIPVSTHWVNISGDTLGATPTLDVGDPGPYILSVVGPNGCRTLDAITVPIDTLSPLAVIDLIGEVRCQLKDVMFSGNGSTPLPLSYSWSTTGGNIMGSNILPVIAARDTGLYQLAVTSLDNGCTDTATYHLVPSPDAILQVSLNVTRPVCHDDLNGAIQITGVTGGIPGFEYQLNGGPPQTDLLFDGLGSGMYLLTVIDAGGCEYDTSILIDPTPAYTVDAGPDDEIYLGETHTLTGSTNLAGSEIGILTWDSLGVTLCTDCPDFDVSPWETTIYEFAVQSVTGCIVKDQMTLFVVEKGKYVIPNIFSPNGDGINDEIRISPTPGMTKVLQWIIFDRWGNAVYGKTDFDPGDPSVFWDGRTTTGEFANPAVFPYLIEFQLINGATELRHGNITLLR